MLKRIQMATFLCWPLFTESVSACHSEIFVDIETPEILGFMIVAEPKTLEVRGEAQYGFLYTLQIPRSLDVSGGHFSADLSERALLVKDLPDHDPAQYFYAETDIRDVCILVASVSVSKCATNYYFGTPTESGDQPRTCMGALGAAGHVGRDDV